ncbi:hypothetical protein NLG97_g5936 [Lecanicillium saksenae]|uniref:Uncharacterized protein n=1 Tax=Lecanicillium saksenae TaxID=468837 RepID=A0ACC1QR26_9HYPO|nr:hypothetical protein NLG97_g5936 [Lecanicillium saksenae]
MASKRVCLAYSGGLDTSVILAWLIEQGYTVVAFLADVGQNEDYDAVKAKAAKIGAERMIIENLQQELVDELVWPAVQCNAVYEDAYMLGTSLARPPRMHGQGNDQVRFELAWRALDQTTKTIIPWRIPEFCERFAGRQALLDFAEAKGVPVTSTKAKPYSMDANLIHCSYEAGMLEQPELEPPADMWTMTVGMSLPPPITSTT